MDKKEMMELMNGLREVLNEVRQYVGARYVPRFIDGGWDETQAYEGLDVVDNGQGTSYIAKKPVPPGTPLTDREYWFVYGASSGAIINLQHQIDVITSDIGDITDKIESNVYQLSNFEGDTPEEKLYNALDTIDYGTISLDMDVEINHTHNMQANGWKDYRRIFIADGNINLNIDYMFDNGSDSLKSYAAPCFVNCNISSNNKKLFRNSFVVDTPSPDVPSSYPFIIGLKFVNCYIYKTIITDSNSVCLQSCHAINCEFRECDHVFNAKAYWDLRLISNQFERTTNYIIKCNSGELSSNPNLYNMYHCVIKNNVIEYTGGTMFTFGKSTDIRIIDNYFEENAIPYCVPHDQIDVFEFTSNYLNEIVANPNDNYVLDVGWLTIRKLIIDQNSTIFDNGVQMVNPDHINDNSSSYGEITVNGGTYTQKLEKQNMYLLTWTSNGGSDYYIEFISYWTANTAVQHVVNTSSYVTTSITNGTLTINTTAVGQYRLLKL